MRRKTELRTITLLSFPPLWVSGHVGLGGAIIIIVILYGH